MTLSPSQIDWLKSAQDGAGNFEAEAKVQLQKNEKLKGIIDKLEADKDTIYEAQHFQIQVARHVGAFKLPFGSKKMPWLSGNVDQEVDSMADITQAVKSIDPDTMDKLNASFEKILERQADMLDAKKEGSDERLFSDEDITRELWSPLVREGIIPSNIVPDKYSEFVQMFKGATEIYEEKLAVHSETASKYENTLEGIGFARDVVSLVGKLGTNALTAVHFGDEAQSVAEKREIMAKQEALNNRQDEITTGLSNDANLPQGLSDAQILEHSQRVDGYAEKLKEYNNIDAAQKELVAGLVGKGKLFAEQKALFAASTTLLDTGLAITEKGIRFSEKEDKGVRESVMFAQDVGDAVTKEIKSIITAAGKTYENETTDGKSQEAKQAFTSTAGILDQLLAGNQLHQKVLIATKAKTKKEREAAILSIVGSLGDTLASTAYACGQANGTISTGVEDSELTTEKDESKTAAFGARNPGNADDQSELVGASIKAAFVASTNVYAAGKALVNKDYKKFTAAILVGLTQAASSGTTATVAELASKDIETLSDEDKAQLEGKSIEEIMDEKLQKSGSNFSETEREQFLKGFQAPSYLNGISDSIAQMQEDLKLVDSDKPELKEIKKKTLIAQDKLEAEKSKNALDELKTKLTDPKEREAYMKDIWEEADEQHNALQKLIDEASPPADPKDEEAIQKSLDAIKVLIADIKASEMKYKLIESIAKGGIQVLVRVVPVTGLVESIRKLTFDAIALGKKAAEVEKWRKNVNLAQASSSVYYHAIKERYNESALQVSQKTINTFLSIVGVAAEAAKLADATQASTGMSIATGMGQALSDFGFKTYGRAKIVFGWEKYLDARQNPENRKLARAAISWNSTLAKCVLAYGIVEAKDPIAKQVGRNCGLTPEILVSNTDVCSGVVKYFETLYSEDPVVLRRVPKVVKWHPGIPDLTVISWLKFKRAAVDKAYPLMAPEFIKTPQIDQAIKELHNLCNNDPFNYPSVRDSKMAEDDWQPKLIAFAQEVKKHLTDLIAGFEKFKPVNAKPSDPKEQVWDAGAPHKDMLEVADALKAQATLILRQVDSDLKAYGAG